MENWATLNKATNRLMAMLEKMSQKIALGGQETYMHDTARGFTRGHRGSRLQQPYWSMFWARRSDALASCQTAPAASPASMKNMPQEAEVCHCLISCCRLDTAFVSSLNRTAGVIMYACRCASSQAIPLFTDIGSFYCCFGLFCTGNWKCSQCTHVGSYSFSRHVRISSSNMRSDGLVVPLLVSKFRVFCQPTYSRHLTISLTDHTLYIWLAIQIQMLI